MKADYLEKSKSKVKLGYILIIGVMMIQCNRNIDHPIEWGKSYPVPRPDSVPLLFLPGIVNTDSLDFNSAFSADGKSFYFGHSTNGRWQMYATHFRDHAWSSPALAPFNNSNYSNADPFITTDGALYYISNQPKNESDTIPDYDIWVVHPKPDGTWAEPENLWSVNSDSTELYVSLAANGNLYFASNRQGGFGSHDIYVSKLINGSYSAPENLGPKINSKESDHDPMISNDERNLVFTSVDRSDGFGQGDLYYSSFSDGEGWTAAKNFGQPINTPTYEYCAYLTADQKYLFYSSEFGVKWIATEYLPLKLK